MQRRPTDFPDEEPDNSFGDDDDVIDELELDEEI